MNFFVSVAAWQSIFPPAWWWRNGGFVQTRSFCRIQPVLVATMEVLQALGHKAISPWGFFLRENKRCKTRTVRMKPTNQESMPVFQTSLQWSLANVKNLDTLWVTLHTPGVFGICCHLLNEVWLIPMIHRSWSTALIARAFEAGEVCWQDQPMDRTKCQTHPQEVYVQQLCTVLIWYYLICSCILVIHLISSNHL